jgi:hypothetical protein
MAATVRKQYRVSEADATTATLVPKIGERKGDPVDPTGIVITWTATPTGTFYVDRIIDLTFEAK